MMMRFIDHTHFTFEHNGLLDYPLKLFTGLQSLMILMCTVFLSCEGFEQGIISKA